MTHIAEQPEADVSQRLSAYRRTREELERNVLPLATSVDGTAFGFQASLHGLQVRRGGYVALETADGVRLGLVTDVRAVTLSVATADGGGGALVRVATGSGVVLDAADTPFHDATVRPARTEEVAAWADSSAVARRGRDWLPVG
ncbi:MAG: hypothetical protein HOQ22_05155 [Nocardioidaceae bacterium]|nr:hypothetical protein [Nocardioidaceae bacterium]